MLSEVVSPGLERGRIERDRDDVGCGRECCGGGARCLVEGGEVGVAFADEQGLPLGDIDVTDSIGDGETTADVGSRSLRGEVPGKKGCVELRCEVGMGYAWLRDEHIVVGWT